MIMLIAREKSSHWYLPSGESFHSVPKKDGTGLRPATIRDARKAGAYPSVTNILSCMGKPGLEAWKQEQAILAALTLPRLENEPLESFARRVVLDMDAQAKSAAERGTRIHDACAEFASGKLLYDEQLRQLCAPFCEWYQANVTKVLAVETVVLNHERKYAGRLDLSVMLRDGRHAILDIKTQERKSGRPFTVYPEWPLQLTAYAKTFQEPCALFSVVLDRVDPGIMVVEWSEQERYWAVFNSIADAWNYLREA